MNSIFLVYSISEVHFLFSFLFFFSPSSMPIGLSFVFVFCFFKIFICLLCTYNASLHCKYTKVVNIIHICTKNGKYCKCVQNLPIFLCLQYKFTL